MSVRALHRASGTGGLRAITPRSADVVIDSADSDRLKIKDSAGVVQSLVRRSDTDPFAAVDGAIRFIEVTVTSAEVLALFATPKTLVPAPGAGKCLVLVEAALILDYAGTAYGGIAAGEDLAIRYTDAAGVIASTTLETTGLLDGTADALRTFKPLTTDITPVANAPLVLHLLIGEVITGNSPLRIKVWYSTFSTGL